MSALILVVDDEPDVAELFRQQFRKELRASRFDMEFAQSAPEALERVGAAEAARLILILSDVNMPGMSGLEMLPRARQARPDVAPQGSSPSRSTFLNCAARSVAGWTRRWVLHDGENPRRRRRARCRRPRQAEVSPPALLASRHLRDQAATR